MQVSGPEWLLEDLPRYLTEWVLIPSAFSITRFSKTGKVSDRSPAKGNWVCSIRTKGPNVCWPILGQVTSQIRKRARTSFEALVRVDKQHAFAPHFLRFRKAGIEPFSPNNSAAELDLPYGFRKKLPPLTWQFDMGVRFKIGVHSTEEGMQFPGDDRFLSSVGVNTINHPQQVGNWRSEENCK